MADSDLVLAKATQRDSLDYEKKLSDSIADDSYDNEVDSIHEGLVFPTEEELLTLRRVSDAIPWTAYCEFTSRSNIALSSTRLCSDCYRGTGRAIFGEFIFILFVKP